MQTKLTFEQSKHIIESRARKELKLSIRKQHLDTLFWDKGKTRNLELTTFTIAIDHKEVYRFPGRHVPYEFIIQGWRAEDMEILLSQFAQHIDSGSQIKMNFALDEQAIFRSRTGKIEKTLLVKYNLAETLYQYVHLGSFY